MYRYLEKSIKSFADLSDQECSEILSVGSVRKIRKKELVLSVDAVCDFLVFVNKGTFRSYIKGANGEERVLYLTFNGEWISDLHSWVTGEQASFAIEALEDSEVMLFYKDKIDPLIEKHPGVQRFFCFFIIKAYRETQQRLAEAISISAASQYKNLVTGNPHIIQKVSLSHIAAYLGVTPESLSRIRKRVSEK